MLKSAMVCFLLAGFLLAPLAAEAGLRDETVVLYLPFDGCEEYVDSLGCW